MMVSPAYHRIGHPGPGAPFCKLVSPEIGAYVGDMLSVSSCKYACLLALIFLAGCTREAAAPPSPLLSGHQLPQPYRVVEFNRLPETNVNVEAARRIRLPMDEDSVELFVYRGDTIYHPLNLCHRFHEFFGAYMKTRDTAFLRHATQYATTLIRIAEYHDGALFLPYQFEYAVHGDSELRLNPPWYSGMAQGQFLLVLVRMYEATGDSLYLDKAQQVFKSLLVPKSKGGPWVARLDSLGYYWIEEYPLSKRPGMTLNGYIAAAYGVYDYRRVIGDSLSVVLYNMVFTTLKQYIPYYRRPGQLSYYCLGHHHPANATYHGLHVGMFGHLARITGDPYFDSMAEVFKADGDSAESK